MHKNLEPQLEQVTQDMPLPCLLASSAQVSSEPTLSPKGKKSIVSTLLGIRVGKLEKPTGNRATLTFLLPKWSGVTADSDMFGCFSLSLLLFPS